jgi:hypothetical protein
MTKPIPTSEHLQAYLMSEYADEWISFDYRGAEEYSVQWKEGVTAPSTKDFEDGYKDSYGWLFIVRKTRDRLLRSTDIWALTDRVMTQSQTDYRQALRDLPQTYPDAKIGSSGTWENITWPTKPGV